MTKSSMARCGILPLTLLIAPGALAGQALTPEEAVAAQQAEIREVVRQVCPESEDPNNVVVCGRRPVEGGPGDYRVPWVPEPGRIARLPGEAPTGMDAMGAERCLRLCAQPLTIDVVGAVRALERGIDRLLHPD